jgi:hypothetical protein
MERICEIMTDGPEAILRRQPLGIEALFVPFRELPAAGVGS